ncbi:protein-ADP-ribose hydrolase [Treponema sp. OMZ 305]|uniref:protein-ADP-ribose hydrolase n=1 Tax=Treponema TaxID=157 RepID=UPI001BAEC99E|nr:MULTISPECIES: protein-ADP-ribose hydrolase [Treponema]QUY19006.1 protein-ADP-ribose hydrolase [Treponema vincentii]UTC58915.1 protein-ADP-ribose hydrolase [Treponema sp. OMZ 305]
MTQTERRLFMIEYLLAEHPQYGNMQIPESETEQKQLLRSLVNVRKALPASEAFLRVQDEYLQEENTARGITELADLKPVTARGNGDLYVWRGDITTLKVDAIVNAVNSGMTGCWQPCHACIDNCIHTFAGIQLRAVCDAMMKKQGHAEPTGQAKITPAFNLPCKYVLHTVGPIVDGELTQTDCDLLASCYTSCLDLAQAAGISSIAFCCISTGVFRFPQEKAAEIAIATVKNWKEKNELAMLRSDAAAAADSIKVVFTVFTEKDEHIYKRILYDRGD